jgi:tRNA(adenine34) deaminase
MTKEIDERFMKMALAEAQKAFDSGEVPVGAVITCNGKLIARGHNQTEMLTDVTAHAEIIAISSASNYLGGKYLKDCTIYVSLEPCPMCAGALFWSQIDRIVFGAYDKKRGFSNYSSKIIHPKTQVTGGVLEEECSDILIDFFRERRV